jgi:hypothetical protein
MQGAFGISVFSKSEMEEVISLRELAASIIRKAPKVVTDPIVCEGIRNGDKLALSNFTSNLSPEQVAMGVSAAAELVCSASFKTRFVMVLKGAYLNLTNCHPPL